MPRFYFHIRNDVDVNDEEGQVLPDGGAVREVALEAARELVCASIHEHGGVNLDHRIEVTDEDGRQVLRMTFQDAFTITG